MTQAYFNPERERDPHALPDCEIFYLSESDQGADTLASHAAGVEPTLCKLDTGWYWQACLPGCLPDGDPVGPFATYAAALADAQSCSDSD